MAAHLAACFTCSGTAETLCLIKHSLRTRPQRTPVDLAEARLHRYADRLMRTDPTPPAGLRLSALAKVGDALSGRDSRPPPVRSGRADQPTSLAKRTLTC
jgi:hypothetical protein